MTIQSKFENPITNVIYNPSVTRTTDSSTRETYLDLDSYLMHERQIFISHEFNDDMADIVIKKLFYLAQQSDSDITIYINSPGGSVSAGLAIIDVMNLIKPDVRTVCVGMAASMGAMLLINGAKGKRSILPNSEVMIHQPLGGARGQATDIEIHAKHILKTKAKLLNMIAEKSGQPLEVVQKDCERDTYLSAEEAVEYGLVDKIINTL